MGSRRIILPCLCAVAAATLATAAAAPDHAAAPDAATDTVEPPPRRVPAGRACVKAGDPRIGKAQNAAAVSTQASFARALAHRGVAPTRLPVVRKRLHRGAGMYQPSGGDAPGTVVQTTVGGVAGRYLAGDVYWTGSARAPDPWELVADGHGKVYRLARRPRAAHTTRIVECGCALQQCGPYGSGCPACSATVQILYGPLPAGTRYAGDLELAYDETVVTVDHAATRCTVQRPCPGPPP
jgi:hypothetical protein